MTGAGGFIGGVIARLLRERGDEVRCVARGEYPALSELGCSTLRGDLANPAVADAAVRDMDAVIHVAAKAGVWGKREEYEASNITATQQLLDACLRHGVSRFVFTSSPSVTFDGKDACNADESLPYSAKHLTHYSRTKAEAERRVLAQNSNSFRTCALRPHLVFGPNDPHLLSRFVDRAKRGRLAWVGKGNLVDVTYVDNAAHAHLLALDALGSENPKPAGKAYFISQGTPVRPEVWMGALLSSIGIPPITRRVPLLVAYALGAAMEAAWTMLGLSGEPLMTRFVAAQLGTSHYYDLSAAKRDFGYQLVVSDDEAHRATVSWLQKKYCVS